MNFGKSYPLRIPATMHPAATPPPSLTSVPLVGVAVNASLAALKIVSGFFGNSYALTSLAAFVGISVGLIGGPGYEPADDWAALVACSVIVFSGLRLLRLGVRDLLDVAPPKTFEVQVRELAQGVPGVRGIEDAIVHIEPYRPADLPSTPFP